MHDLPHERNGVTLAFGKLQKYNNDKASLPIFLYSHGRLKCQKIIESKSYTHI